MWQDVRDHLWFRAGANHNCNLDPRAIIRNFHRIRPTSEYKPFAHLLLRIATLDDILRHYPVLEVICENLRALDLHALSRVNRDARLSIRNQGQPDSGQLTAVTERHKISCTCGTDSKRTCPRHGTPTLRNLLGKTEHASRDALRAKRPALTREQLKSWMIAIIDALEGGISNINSCQGCGTLVCFA